MKTNELKVGDKVEIDTKAIDGSEYKFQFPGKVRKFVYVYDVINLYNPTFEFKATPKAKKNGVLPIEFIKKIISSGTKLSY